MKYKRVKMSVLLLQLCLCVIGVIQLTSAAKHDKQDTADCCKRIEGVLTLMGMTFDQQLTSLSELLMAVSQLQIDVDELKAASLEAVVKECPADFTWIESVRGCYKVVNHNVDWSMAGLACRAVNKHAHLLVIGDAQEQTAVAEMLDSLNQATLSGCFKGDNGVHFWTAGQRIDPDRESDFVWRVTTSDSNSEISLISYTNWSPRQPDYFEQQQSCLNIWSGRSYTWSDESCSNEFCSVCEIDITA